VGRCGVAKEKCLELFCFFWGQAKKESGVWDNAPMTSFKNFSKNVRITSAFLLLLKKNVQRIITIHLLGLFLFLFSLEGGAIVLSDQTDISILTCGPGEMIHAIYGHTAIRVKDPAQGLDIVFNYGVFSFSKPNFVYRFAKGQTDYMLAPERYPEFYEGYKNRGRSIDEQVLNLSAADKQKLWNFLVENARPENREYRYNFFLDNCATRVRDVIKNQVTGTIHFPGTGEGVTFRQHIDLYQKVLPWTDFGIDLALGSPADRVATADQEMFLPDYLMKHFGCARIDRNGESVPLVKETHTLYEADNKPAGVRVATPVQLFSTLLLVILLISIRQYRKGIKDYLTDYLLLFFTGLIGFAALWLMIWSEHPAVQSNFNVLWAVPFNLFFMVAWISKKWRSAIRWYWPLLSGWLVLFLLLGFLVPQSFHPAVYLIALTLLCRSVLHTLQLYGKGKGH
jgi:hypothetical protein